jgi:DNA adenine methylase
MQYLGGKSKLSKKVAASIAARRGDLLYWEPFCGSLAVSVRVPGPGVLSDLCSPLMSLYRAVGDGWDPPSDVSEETWRGAKVLPDSDPMKAFCGFGVSFGGKWFAGYARDAPHHCSYYAAAARRALLRDVPRVLAAGHIFGEGSFFDVAPQSGFLLYLDPPYAGTTPYLAIPRFDSAAFYQRAKEWSEAGSRVLISEYTCPIGTEIWSAAQNCDVALTRARRATRTERLFEVTCD